MTTGGLIYLRFVSDDEQLSWVQYCNIFSSFPLDLQSGIKDVVDSINTDFKTDVIIKMGYDAQNGCFMVAKNTDYIACVIYNRFNTMLSNLTGKINIRLAYSIGEIEVLKTSVHTLHSEPLVVNVGRFLDEKDDPGIFKI